MESFWEGYIGVSTPKDSVLRGIVNVLRDLRAVGANVERVDEHGGIVEGTINQTFSRGTKYLKIRVANQPGIFPSHPYGSSVYIEIGMNEANKDNTCWIEGLAFGKAMFEHLGTEYESSFVALAPDRIHGKANDPGEEQPIAYPRETYPSYDGIAYPPPIGLSYSPPPVAAQPPPPTEPYFPDQSPPQPSFQKPKFCYSCGTPFGDRADKVKFCPTCGEKID